MIAWRGWVSSGAGALISPDTLWVPLAVQAAVRVCGQKHRWRRLALGAGRRGDHSVAVPRGGTLLHGVTSQLRKHRNGTGFEAAVALKACSCRS